MKEGRPRLYFAAPLFNEQEREFNLRLARRIEAHADVFLPQRDGGLLDEMIRSGVPLSAAEERVFGQDVQAMIQSDLLLAVLDGSHVDEGVAFEIGFMRGLGKVCYGLQTDIRRALPTGNNPMISRGLNLIFNDVADAIRQVEAFSHLGSRTTLHSTRRIA